MKVTFTIFFYSRNFKTNSSGGQKITFNYYFLGYTFGASATTRNGEMLSFHLDSRESLFLAVVRISCLCSRMFEIWADQSGSNYIRIAFAFQLQSKDLNSHPHFSQLKPPSSSGSRNLNLSSKTRSKKS
jgi:hypothetical protein